MEIGVADHHVGTDQTTFTDVDLHGGAEGAAADAGVIADAQQGTRRQGAQHHRMRNTECRPARPRTQNDALADEQPRSLATGDDGRAHEARTRRHVGACSAGMRRADGMGGQLQQLVGGTRQQSTASHDDTPINEYADRSSLGHTGATS